jgi:hypothetical protein
MRLDYSPGKFISGRVMRLNEIVCSQKLQQFPNGCNATLYGHGIRKTLRLATKIIDAVPLPSIDLTENGYKCMSTLLQTCY